MSIFRPVSAPQVVIAGLALFATGATGPVVPQTNVAQLFTQSPWPYAAVQDALWVGAVSLIPSLGTQVPPGSTQRAQSLSQWPYVGTQTAPPRVIVQAAPVVPPRVSTQQSQTPWPYVPVQNALRAGTAPLVPNLGTQISPSPVLQWATQTPWPHVGALLPKASNFAPVLVYTMAPVLVPVRLAEWPYAATLLPEATASQYAQQAVLVPPAVVQQIAPVSTWSYTAPMGSAGPASTQQAALVPQAGVAMPTGAAWPYAAVQDALWTGAVLVQSPVTQVAPSPVVFFGAYAWPYIASQPTPPRTIVQLVAPIPAGAVPQIAATLWPYASVQGVTETGAAPLVPSVGTQIPPSPVLQWLTQPPWPLAATVLHWLSVPNVTSGTANSGVVAINNRTYLVPSQYRLRVVPAQDRGYLVPRQDRTQKV